jgi:hypothetical protein
VVFAAALLTTQVAGLIRGFVVTFPYSGVLVVIETRHQLADFSRQFTLNSLGLVAFLVGFHFAQGPRPGDGSRRGVGRIRGHGGANTKFLADTTDASTVTICGRRVEGHASRQSQLTECHRHGSTEPSAAGIVDRSGRVARAAAQGADRSR